MTSRIEKRLAKLESRRAKGLTRRQRNELAFSLLLAVGAGGPIFVPSWLTPEQQDEAKTATHKALEVLVEAGFHVDAPTWTLFDRTQSPLDLLTSGDSEAKMVHAGVMQDNPDYVAPEIAVVACQDRPESTPDPEPIGGHGPDIDADSGTSKTIPDPPKNMPIIRLAPKKQPIFSTSEWRNLEWYFT